MRKSQRDKRNYLIIGLCAVLVVMAVGPSGMAQNVSNSSTQKTVLINLNSYYEGPITLGPISYTPSKNYQSILISSNDLKENSYNLNYGSNSMDVNLTGTVTSLGTENRGFNRNLH